MNSFHIFLADMERGEREREERREGECKLNDKREGKEGNERRERGE